MSTLPGEERVEREVVRTRRLTATLTGVEAILLALRREKFTGQLEIHMSQGGMQGVLLREVQRLPEGTEWLKVW